MRNAERPPSAQGADYGKVASGGQGFRPLDDDQLKASWTGLVAPLR